MRAAYTRQLSSEGRGGNSASESGALMQRSAVTARGSRKDELRAMKRTAFQSSSARAPSPALSVRTRACSQSVSLSAVAAMAIHIWSSCRAPCTKGAQMNPEEAVGARLYIVLARCRRPLAAFVSCGFRLRLCGCSVGTPPPTAPSPRPPPHPLSFSSKTRERKRERKEGEFDRSQTPRSSSHAFRQGGRPAGTARQACG